MTPVILEAYRAGLLKRSQWLPNITSGLIVGLVALPLAMAFAIAIGAKPQQGIYTAIIAGFLVSTLGGSRVQIAGPTGAFIVILSGVVAKYGISGLQIATLMAGILLVFFGFVRMGAIIKFVPAPVVVGFTAGIAITIWVGQWQNFFGLPAPEQGVPYDHFHEKIWYLLQHLPQMDWRTTFFAVVSLLLILFSYKIPRLKKVPGPLVALVVVTLLYSVLGLVFDLKEVATIGEIPNELPKFAPPAITLKAVVELIAPAFTIAILGAIESLLSAVVADSMTNTRHNSNQELIGQGIANIVTPLFGGFAATGAIARTATNIRNGGTSPISGIVHCLTLLIILLVLAPLASNVPLATLAAILFVVSWNMSEVKRFKAILRTAPRADILILLTTFLLTVFADLVVAVNIGVILAMVHFLRRMSSSVEIRQSTEREIDDVDELPPGICVYTVEGPLFFGVADKFERTLIDHVDIDPEMKVMVIFLHWVPFIDITGLQVMEKVVLHMHNKGVQVILAGANKRVQHKLRKAGIIRLTRSDHNFLNISEALVYSQTLLEHDMGNENLEHIAAENTRDQEKSITDQETN